MCVYAQLCLTLCDSTEGGLPVSSVHDIFQARTLEWVAISSPSDVNSYAQDGEMKTEHALCVCVCVCVCSCMDLIKHVLWFTHSVHISENVQFSVWV